METAPTESLAEIATRTMEAHWRETLPGFGEYLKRNDKARQWIVEQEQKIDAAIRDDDRILLDRALGNLERAIERVNETLAEEFRKEHSDPATWPLNVLKWMKRVQYICFESPLGEFYVLPRPPARRPKVDRWYTADEMIDMLHPTVAAAIQIFGSLPVRPTSIPGPAPGDKSLHIHVTDAGVTMQYEMGGQHGGKRFR